MTRINFVIFIMFTQTNYIIHGVRIRTVHMPVLHTVKSGLDYSVWSIFSFSNFSLDQTLRYLILDGYINILFVVVVGTLYLLRCDILNQEEWTQLGHRQYWWLSDTCFRHLVLLEKQRKEKESTEQWEKGERNPFWTQERLPFRKHWYDFLIVFTTYCCVLRMKKKVHFLFISKTSTHLNNDTMTKVSRYWCKHT